MTTRVYVATPMTGRSKEEQVARARNICNVLRQHGLEPISPVLEEQVADEPGALVQTSKEKLEGFWKRDKQIMTYQARVTLIDGGDEGSVGVGREHGYNRYCIWKPTVVLWRKDRGITVAQFEDDAIFVNDEFAAAKLIQDKWGTWPKYALWRVLMLLRSLPKFLLRQIVAWR